MYFDTHAHLEDAAFDEDREKVTEGFLKAGVSRVLNAGSSIESSKKTIELCDRYSFIYGACGLHPDAAADFKTSQLYELSDMAKNKKIRAIGEIGLDYYYDDVPREAQLLCFEAQVALAKELSLPVIVHDRDAHRDTFDVLKKFDGIKVVYHCFSGSVEYSREILERGYYMSFGGAVTFKNARHAPEVLKNAPHGRIFLETDCPYMAPVPYRGKRNDPGFVPLVAKKIAELWGKSTEYVAETTYNNANEFFGIED